MTTLYGIKNCDTIRKARRWLKENSIDYTFHDVRKEGISEAMLNTWLKALDWELLLNRRGTTWRQLPASVRENIDRKTAIKIMHEHPAIIKRPVLDFNRQLHVGFSDDRYTAIFNPNTPS